MKAAGLSGDKRAALAALREALGPKALSGAEIVGLGAGVLPCPPRGDRAPAERGRAASSVGDEGDGARGGGEESEESEAPSPWRWLSSLPLGQLTEILGGGERAVGGSGLLMGALLARARRRREYVALLDLGGGFDPWSFPEEDLETLLWVVCASAEEALEAGEVVAKDGNFRHLLFDFRGRPGVEWRKLPTSRWYRLLAAIRVGAMAGVVFSDEPVTPASAMRWRVALSPARDGSGGEAGEAGETAEPEAQVVPELPETLRAALDGRLAIEIIKGAPKELIE